MSVIKNATATDVFHFYSPTGSVLQQGLYHQNTQIHDFHRITYGEDFHSFFFKDWGIWRGGMRKDEEDGEGGWRRNEKDGLDTETDMEENGEEKEIKQTLRRVKKII